MDNELTERANNLIAEYFKEGGEIAISILESLKHKNAIFPFTEKNKNALEMIQIIADLSDYNILYSMEVDQPMIY